MNEIFDIIDSNMIVGISIIALVATCGVLAYLYSIERMITKELQEFIDKKLTK